MSADCLGLVLLTFWQIADIKDTNPQNMSVLEIRQHMYNYKFAR